MSRRRVKVRPGPGSRAAHQVGVQVKPAKHGQGVFATQDIAAGQTVWKFDPVGCTRWDSENIQQVAPETLADNLWKGYLNPTMEKVVE